MKRYQFILFLAALLAMTSLNICSYGQELRPVKGLNDKWGFVDESGKEIIPFTYDEVGEFSEGLARAMMIGKFGWHYWGFIDKTGKVIIPLKYNGVGDFSEGLARAMISRGGFLDWGFIDKTGKEVIPLKYSYVGDFSEGLARVKASNGRWGFINQAGNAVISFIYDDAKDFSEGLAQVRIKRKWGFIDNTGKEVAKDVFSVNQNDTKSEDHLNITNIHDVITLRNGSEIKARVTEVSPTEIRYNRFENLEGPTIVIPRKDVFAINYANGTRDVINPINATNKGRTVGEPQSQSKLGLQGGVNFPEGGYLNLFNNYMSGEHYVKSKTGFQIGLITDMPFKNQQFGFQPVLSFFQLGLEFGNKGHNPWKSEVKMNFLQVRGNIRYKIGQGDTSLSLQTGPSFNYPLHYKKIDDGKAVESELTKKGLSDFGVGLGAALIIGGRVQLCGGYNIGVKVNYTMLNLTVYMFGN